MKSTYLTIALLALTTPFTVLARPAIPPSQSLTVSAETTDFNPGDDSISNSKIMSDELAASRPEYPRVAADGNCISITFTSSNPNSNYHFNGDWGLGNGTISSLGTQSLCGSGAMFVGQQTYGTGLGAISGGNTKLECTVKGDGKVDNVCNVSIVDGFSLSMYCTGFGTGDIGGTQDLFGLGSCPDRNDNGPTCVNRGGHSNTAAPFFRNGGRYWFEDDVFVGVTFGGNPALSCAVGG